MKWLGVTFDLNNPQSSLAFLDLYGHLCRKEIKLIQLAVNTVKAIDMKNFIDYLHDKKLSGSTVKKNYNIINRMYNELVKMQMLKSNPCNQIVENRKKNMQKLRSLMKVN